ncbi:hypothetical protein V1517DRAFT_320041, partial [Lipomyces orientalis]
MDMTLGKVENAGSDYCNALQLLKDNPPEQRLDIHAPYSQYLKLEKSWSKYKSETNISEDQKYYPMGQILIQQLEGLEVQDAFYTS